MESAARKDVTVYSIKLPGCKGRVGNSKLGDLDSSLKNAQKSLKKIH